MTRRALAEAFHVTVPVLVGYLAIGIAFGLMLQAIGYNFIWAFFMSLTIYAGSGQYLGVSLLATEAALTQVALLTFLLNFRHIVYGLSLIEKFGDIHGLKKFYMPVRCEFFDDEADSLGVFDMSSQRDRKSVV